MVIEREKSGTKRPRTLIIGAGVAGLTLAALLRQRGEDPVVIERESALTHTGYMLGLYPMGSRVLHGLGLFPQFLEHSVSMRHYNIGNGQGQIIREYSLEAVAQRYGAIQGISRGQLIELLLAGVGDLPIRMGTTVTALKPRGAEVAVTFSDGSEASFDLVVAADGLHSETRKLILDAREYAYWNTGWGGWVFWDDPHDTRQDTYTEYWGAGRFLGLYPVKDKLGVFIGGPTSTAQAMGLEQFTRHVFEHFRQPVPVAADRVTVEGATDSFFWNFHDCRSALWRKGRVVLLGDAATGFIPTAGVGASMAMESAAALNDELSRTDAQHVELALDLYEKRHRQRVEAAQASSRGLGRMMFLDSRPLSWGRNQLLRFYSVEQLVSSIAKLADDPI